MAHHYIYETIHVYVCVRVYVCGGGDNVVYWKTKRKINDDLSLFVYLSICLYMYVCICMYECICVCMFVCI